MSTLAAPSSSAPERTVGAPRLRVLLCKRIWLPRPLYVAVPWIYLACGTGALAGGLYLPDPAWPLPYAVLLALGCLHAGIAILSWRHRRRPRTAGAPCEQAGPVPKRPPG